ncbi:MAG: phenylalanine--tRNA ligase subunit alpha, partial [Campylobacteraceae bacterium]|nr:phenylalanine--tRNA ligase subunit alpha [Campylobacteraceae bacterium]
MKAQEKAIHSSESLDALEKIRLEIFGKKGYFAKEFVRLKDLKGDEKKELASTLNQAKDHLSSLLNEKKEALELLFMDKSMLKESVD